jgi:HEPN domain-containing protein
MKPGERLPPDDPREWIRRARSNLALARSRQADVYLEDLCFEAQQAAEKAVKAVLLHRGIEPPRTHDLGRLLSALEESGEAVPADVKAAVELTPFAVIGRYPGPLRAITEEEYEQAVVLAERTVAWAAERIGEAEPDEEG